MENLVFSNPQMLWGVVAVALPGVIQFLLKRKSRVVPWGATRFLRFVISRTQASSRIRSWLKLFVQTLLVACVVLSLSDPAIVRHDLSITAASSTHHLVVLDVSMSMQAHDEWGDRWERARKLLDDLLQQAQPGDTWQLLLHGTVHDPIRIRIPVDDVEFVRSELEVLSPTYESGVLSETAQRALQLSNHFPPSRNLVWVLSDFCSSDWGQNATAGQFALERFGVLSHVAELRLIDVARDAEVNVAVEDVTIQQELNSSAATVSVHLNRSGTPQTPLRVPVNLESIQAAAADEIALSATVNLAASSASSIHQELTFNEPKLHLCRAVVGEDALAGDNTFYFTVPVRDAPRVLIVDRQASSNGVTGGQFAQLALTVTSGEAAFRVDRISWKELVDALSKSTYDVLIVTEAPQLTSTHSGVLREFVASGGGVILVASDEMNTEHWNQQLGPEGLNLLPGRISRLRQLRTDAASKTQSTTLEPILESHPIIAPFHSRPETGLHTTRFYRYLQVEPKADAILIATVDGGAPLILERPFGRGTVLFITTAFDPQWGSWVLWPSFVPMLQRSVDYLDSRQQQVLTSTIGQAIPVERLTPEIHSIVDANNRIVWSRTSHSASADRLGQAMSEPGIYRWLSADNPLVRTVICRNSTKEESDLTRVSKSELLKRCERLDIPITINDSIEEIGFRLIDDDRQRRTGIAGWLALVALILLLTDQVLIDRVDLGLGILFGLAGGLLFAWPLSESPVGRVSLLLLTIFATTSLAQLVSWTLRHQRPKTPNGNEH